MVEEKEVSRAIKYHYPKIKGENMMKAFRKLKKMPISKPDESGEVLIISTCGDPNHWVDIKKATVQDMIERNYYDVHTRKFLEETSYSLSFRPWKELINIRIDRETLDHITYPEIVAHFLWEITYYGDEAETKKVGDEILKRGKEAMVEIEKEGKYTVC